MLESACELTLDREYDLLVPSGVHARTWTSPRPLNAHVRAIVRKSGFCHGATPASAMGSTFREIGWLVDVGAVSRVALQEAKAEAAQEFEALLERERRTTARAFALTEDGAMCKSRMPPRYRKRTEPSEAQEEARKVDEHAAFNRLGTCDACSATAMNRPSRAAAAACLKLYLFRAPSLRVPSMRTTTAAAAGANTEMLRILQATAAAVAAAGATGNSATCVAYLTTPTATHARSAWNARSVAPRPSVWHARSPPRALVLC